MRSTLPTASFKVNKRQIAATSSFSHLISRSSVRLHQRHPIPLLSETFSRLTRLSPPLNTLSPPRQLGLDPDPAPQLPPEFVSLRFTREGQTAAASS